MPIEFRCNQCGKLLRTGDETAGQQARCPSCGTVMPIPTAGPVTASFEPHAATMTSSPITPPPPPPGADSQNPYQSPGAYPTTPAGGPAPASFQPTIIDFGDVFSRTWNIFKDQWGRCLLAVLIVVGFNIVAGYGLPFGGRLFGFAIGGRPLGEFFSSLGNLAGMLLSLWIGIGQTLFFLGIARGEPVEIGQLFSGGPYFLRILGATVIAAVALFFGFLLLIVPAIFLGLMFWPYYLLIIDRKLGVFESFQLAMKITDGNKLTVLLIAVVLFVLTVISLIPCGLGLVVTLPFLGLIWPVIYLAMTGQPTADQRQPAGW